MAAKICLDCTAVYTTDAAKCPQCGSTRSRFDWEEPATDKAPATGGIVTAADPVHVVEHGPAALAVPPNAKPSSAGGAMVELECDGGEAA